MNGRVSTVSRIAVFSLPGALAATTAFMAIRIAHTVPAPPESERGVVSRLARVDATGTVVEAFDLPGRYIQPRWGPGARSVLLMRMPSPGKPEMWRFTFASSRLERASADAGKPMPGFEDAMLVIEDRSRDGVWIALTASPNWLNFSMHPVVRPNESILVRASTAATYRLLQPTAGVYELRFSRDGRRLALTSSMSGANEVYVAELPADPTGLPIDAHSLVRISTGGGHAPEWGPGGELYFMDSSGDLRNSNRALFHMDSVAGPEFEYRYGGYCVGDDGRLLIAMQRRRGRDR